MNLVVNQRKKLREVAFLRLGKRNEIVVGKSCVSCPLNVALVFKIVLFHQINLSQSKFCGCAKWYLNL